MWGSSENDDFSFKKKIFEKNIQLPQATTVAGKPVAYEGRNNCFRFRNACSMGSTVMSSI